MRAVIQIGCGVVLVACGVVACRGGLPTKRTAPSDRPPTSVEVPGAQAGEAVRPPGAREYRIVDTESLLQIFALRGGTLARMGHNHVIASRHLRGSVVLTNDPTETRLAMTIPVTLLTIDEPALRALAGPEFASEVPDTAREGTRKNLLSEALLDGDRFPGIELQCVAVERQGDGLIAMIAVTVRSVTTQHRVPVNLRRDGDAAVATGQLTLRQSDVGLAPFSVMLGALAVQDELQVRFEIVARAVNP
jgi:polyisoprenoid-binding protein YceI